MANPMDDYEIWWLDAPYGCGALRTVGGQVVRGGAPIFNKLAGQMLRLLPKSYHVEFLCVEPFIAASRQSQSSSARLKDQVRQSLGAAPTP